MKKTILLSVLAIAIGLSSYGQYYLGVSPGLTTNSVNFGYRLDKLVPYVAFQALAGSYNQSYTSRYWESGQWEEDNSDIKARINLLVPTIGAKYFAFEENDLKAFVNLSVSKPFISGKLEHNNTVNDSFGEIFEKISILGAEIGVGAEYFFSKNFSIGGEYSLRLLHGAFENVDEYEYNGQTATDVLKMSVNAFPTIARFSLNYYFGAK